MAEEEKKQKTPDDPARQAAKGLESTIEDVDLSDEVVVLDEEMKKRYEAEHQKRQQEKVIAPENEQKQLDTVSNRQRIRVLMITDDISVFSDGSAAQEKYCMYASLFDELHVIVRTSRKDGHIKGKRPGINLWLYPTHSRSWIFSIYDAYRLGVSQLSFATGFRADIIATHGPFESGLAGYFLARRFKRTLQVHVYADPFDPYFEAQEPKNKWLVFVARFVLRRADCVRVTSEHLKAALLKKLGKRLRTVVVLPMFRDLKKWRDKAPTFSLKERYAHFKFIMLMVAPLTKRQNIDFAINAASYMLSRYPTVGLVLVGDGPYHGVLKQKVSEMKIQDHIIFEPATEDTVSHMKSADILLNTADFEENDMVVSQAAAAGLPILSTEGGFASALIEDEKSGLLCKKDDLVCFQARLNNFLNDNAGRNLLAMNARDRVFSLIEQDESEYQRQYAQSFVQCVVDSYKEE